MFFFDKAVMMLTGTLISYASINHSVKFAEESGKAESAAELQSISNKVTTQEADYKRLPSILHAGEPNDIGLTFGTRYGNFIEMRHEQTVGMSHFTIFKDHDRTSTCKVDKLLIYKEAEYKNYEYDFVEAIANHLKSMKSCQKIEINFDQLDISDADRGMFAICFLTQDFSVDTSQDLKLYYDKAATNCTEPSSLSR